MKLPGDTDFSLLEGLFEDMRPGKYGGVVRAKALVQTTEGPYRFDLSFGKTAGPRIRYDFSGQQANHNGG